MINIDWIIMLSISLKVFLFKSHVVMHKNQLI